MIGWTRVNSFENLLDKIARYLSKRWIFGNSLIDAEIEKQLVEFAYVQR